MQPVHLPIINYHKIEVNNDVGATSRHPDDFLKDLIALKEFGCQTITFKELNGERFLKPKQIIITFDDGYESVYRYALPMMKEHGFKGVVFIPVQYIGKENNWDIQFFNKKYKHLNIEQLLSLQKAGFEIASHGMTHRDFTELNAATLENEILRSKSILSRLIQKEVISICYPFGQFNDAIKDIVKNAGYQYGVSTLYFGGGLDKYPQYSLKRFTIYRFDSQKMVLRKLKNNYNGAIAFRDWAIQLGAKAAAFYQQLNDK
jgi:peptidoglycan/xylan/chitin deacetylase (PgdA/CDA1 family)